MAALLDSACPLLGVVRSQEFPPSPPSGQRQPPYDPSAAVARASFGRKASNSVRDARISNGSTVSEKR